MFITFKRNTAQREMGGGVHGVLVLVVAAAAMVVVVSVVSDG